MSKQHQSTSWQVLARTARHLRLDSATRLHARAGGWLSVAEGRVWITRDGGGLDHYEVQRTNGRFQASIIVGSDGKIAGYFTTQP